MHGYFRVELLLQEHTLCQLWNILMSSYKTPLHLPSFHHLWFPAFVCSCCIAYTANPAALQPWGRNSFCSQAFLLSFLVYLKDLSEPVHDAARPSHLHCVPEFLRTVREKCWNISDKATAYSEGAKKKKEELGGCKCSWAERRRRQHSLTLHHRTFFF